MLSTFAPVFTSDPFLGNPFSTFDGGFTPWDCPEILEALQSYKPIIFNSGSDVPLAPKPDISSPGSDEQDTNQMKNEREKPFREVPAVVDERKRRRMISNRESARRSRMRKQKHLENLRNQVNRLRIQNRELSNRLRFVSVNCHRVLTENDRLQSEHDMLRQKLSEIRQILIFRQLQQQLSPVWPCDNIMSEQNPPIITQLQQQL